MAETVNEQRAQKARVHSEMQSLYLYATTLRRVVNSDGTIIELVQWTNADAERRYCELKERYDYLTSRK